VFCSPDCKTKFNSKQKEQKKVFFADIEIKTQIPLKYHNIETDKTEILNMSINKNLFITGSVGTGKTVFAASIAKYYIKNGENVLWISYPNFIMQVQNKYSKNDQSETAYDIAEKTAFYAGYLVIDDLGAEKLTDFVKQITYYILNTREQHCLRTIITSNFSLSDINDQIDERISSRILGMCDVLKFTGQDKRQTDWRV
jgi:DNA replication protein DnaC